MTRYAVRAEDLSKRFWLNSARHTSLKERVVRGKVPKGHEFWALRGASFEIERGSSFGLIGQNGSGKSTTLKVLAGIYRPTSGKLIVDGRVSALLELGSGFHGDLTGRENIRLNGAILGLTGKQINGAMDKIVDFAGIGEFIDLPVKIYSSGMIVRLGFAIAASLDPEILMVDEVVAVGDEEFQRKCFDRLFELRKGGATIVLVTHALGLIRDMCDQAMWLEHGQIRQLGPAMEVADKYLADVNDRELQTQVSEPEEPTGAKSKRLGSGEVRITAVEFLDGQGKLSPVLLAGAPCTMRMHYVAHESVSHVVFGIGFLLDTGANISGPNSGRQGSWSLAAGSGYVDFVVEELLLQPAVYRVSTAIVDRGHTYDLADREFDLHVRGSGNQEPGFTRMPGIWRDPVVVAQTVSVAVGASEDVHAGR